jgi:hypothetical protein
MDLIDAVQMAETAMQEAQAEVTRVRAEISTIDQRNVSHAILFFFTFVAFSELIRTFGFNSCLPL